MGLLSWLDKALHPLRNWQHPPPPAEESKPQRRVVNSITGASLNIDYLLNAFRSMAPGTWTDSKYEQARHFVGMTYIALNTIAKQAANATVKVYRTSVSTDQDSKQLCRDDDPLVRFLHNPNNDDTIGDILEQLAIQQGLTGMSLLWLVPNGFESSRLGLSPPAEMYVIPTGIAVPLPVMSPMYPNGAYRIMPMYPNGPFTTWPAPLGASGAVLPAEMIVRVKNPHPLLRYDGYSPLTATRLQADAVEAIDRGRWYAQMRGVDPSVVMEFDSDVQMPNEDDIKKIRAEFEALFTGPENVGRLLITPPGTEVKPWSAAPKDMAWESGWQQLTDFLMAAYGVTKPVAGMIQESSYSTLYAALKQFHHLTLCPLLNRIAAKWTKYLGPRFGPDYLIEIEAPRIDDEQMIEQMLSNDKSVGCRTVNEWRILRGLPPTKEKWGDERAGMPPHPPQPGAPEEGEEGADGEEQESASQEMSALERLLSDDNNDIESERPSAGSLGTGSLGPRMAKSLNGNGHANGFHDKDKVYSPRAGERGLRVLAKALDIEGTPFMRRQELVDAIMKRCGKDRDYVRGGNQKNPGQFSSTPGAGARPKQVAGKRGAKPTPPSTSQPKQPKPSVAEDIEAIKQAWTELDTKTLVDVHEKLKSRSHIVTDRSLRAIAGAIGLQGSEKLKKAELLVAVMRKIGDALDENKNELVDVSIPVAQDQELIRLADDFAGPEKPGQNSQYQERLREPWKFTDEEKKELEAKRNPETDAPVKDRATIIKEAENGTGRTYMGRVLGGILAMHAGNLGLGEQYKKVLNNASRLSKEEASMTPDEVHTVFETAMLNLRQAIRDGGLGRKQIEPILEAIDAQGYGTLSYDEVKRVIDNINPYLDRAAYKCYLPMEPKWSAATTQRAAELT